MNLVNKVKDKWAEKRFKKLEKEAIRLREDILKLPDQEGNLKTAEAIPILANLKSHSVTKKSEKYANDKTGHDQEEKFVNTVRPDRLGQEDIKSSITMRKDTKTKVCYKFGLRGHIAHNCKTENMNPRQENKVTKRCHFCRKRGHIKRNCPIKQKCWNWMKGGSV